jgi:HSP20 family protein
MYLNVYRPSVVHRVNGQSFSGLVDSVLNDLPFSANEGEVVSHARFDVVETATGYEAFIEMPGVTKEDIDISVDGTIVSVKAEAKRAPVNAETDRVLFSQRRTTRFERRFELPLEVAEDKSEATYENGVLKLVLPKKEVVQPKRLAVK